MKIQFLCFLFFSDSLDEIVPIILHGKNVQYSSMIYFQPSESVSLSSDSDSQFSLNESQKFYDKVSPPIHNLHQELIQPDSSQMMHIRCSTPIPYLEAPSFNHSLSSSDGASSDDENVPLMPHSQLSQAQFSERMSALESKHIMSAACVTDVLHLFQDVIPVATIPSYYQMHSKHTVNHLFHQELVGKNEFFVLNLKHQLSVVLTQNMTSLTSDTLHLLFFTDGAPLIKSANRSFWPIFLAVTELVPEVRFKWRNLILAGVWFYGRPEWNLFLPPILENIQSVDCVVIGGYSKKLQLKVSGMITDLPARASILQMKQFNGRFSCVFCEIEGKYRIYRTYTVLMHFITVAQ
jgi:hypothetical protein